VCCSVLQHVADNLSYLHAHGRGCAEKCGAVRCSALQYVAVRCSVLQTTNPHKWQGLSGEHAFSVSGGIKSLSFVPAFYSSSVSILGLPPAPPSACSIELQDEMVTQVESEQVALTVSFSFSRALGPGVLQSALQCVAECVAVCCRVRCSVLQSALRCVIECVAVCYRVRGSVLQSALQCVAECAAVCCRACCSVLQSITECVKSVLFLQWLLVQDLTHTYTHTYKYKPISGALAEEVVNLGNVLFSKLHLQLQSP